MRYCQQTESPVRWETIAGGNGHYYEVVSEPQGIGWFDAKNGAEARSGYLATITSAAENQFVYNLAVQGSLNLHGGPWLGGYQDPNATQVSQGWGWVTGEPWTYTNWSRSTQEPNDGANRIENHEEDFLHFYYWSPERESSWNDNSNAVPLLAFVVEYESTPFTKLANLDFDAPVPGGIRDKNGLGTGFSDWLPGTGGSIPRHDPNLDLQAMPGYLLFTSQRADINQQNPLGQNLDTLDAPGVLLTEMAGRDLRITARFDDVSVADAFDQLELYVGTDADNVLRGGMHQAAAPNDGQFVLAGNTGSGDFGFPLIGLPGSFATGDDIELSLSRIDGEWSMVWDNLTNPAANGHVEGIVVPWLDGEESLYVGLMHLDARNTTAQIAKVGYFCVELGPIPEPNGVPEPAALTLLALGVGFIFIRRVR